MHPHTFDRLTCHLAIRRGRRHLVRGAFSLAAALVLNRHGTAVAQEDCPGGCPEGHVCASGGCFRPCLNNRDCRSKQHDDPCMLHQCLDGVCIEAIVDCVPGYECCEGSCCPKTCSMDVECAVVDPCRWGACGPDGICAYTEIDPCVICAGDAECQADDPNSVCCDGACHRACPEGTLMGKGCECQANGSATQNGLVVRDDASG